MEAHAAVPDLHDLLGMGEEVTRLVEENMAEAAAEHDGHDHPEDEVVGPVDGKRGLAIGPEVPLLDEPADVEPAEYEARGIRQSVPFDRHGTERKGYRTNVRVRNDESAHGKDIRRRTTILRLNSRDGRESGPGRRAKSRHMNINALKAYSADTIVG